MKAFVVYPPKAPQQAVLVYVKKVNYQAARSLALAHHWSWKPATELKMELAPRWETDNPPKHFCIYDHDLKDGLPPFGELKVSVQVEAPAKQKAWKVYHFECKEETLLVYANNQFEAKASSIADNPYDWAQADLVLLRAFGVPDWDHEAPPVANNWSNETIHRDLPDFFSDTGIEPLDAHYHKRSNTK